MEYILLASPNFSFMYLKIMMMLMTAIILSSKMHSRWLSMY